MNAESERVRVAYHEAGHAVAFFLMKKRFGTTTIIPEGDTLGMVHAGSTFSRYFDGIGRTLSDRVIEAAVTISCAGYTAEELHGEVDDYWGAEEDIKRSQDFALILTGADEEEALAYVKFIELRTKRLFKGSWAAVEAMAGSLLTSGKVSYPRARKIIAEALADDEEDDVEIVRVEPGEDDE